MKEKILKEIVTMKAGDPTDFTNFMAAVIDKAQFDKVVSYIKYAKENSSYEILCGGTYDDSTGYFIQPTVILTKEPKSKLMTEEIFGPVLTVYLYDDEKYEETLKICDETSPYGLTGSIFARDREALAIAERLLRFATGNFYRNDKPTGAVIAQQPFGGSRGSGTNDKAGSFMNLLRWISARAIKETLVPPTDYRLPSMAEP